MCCVCRPIVVDFDAVAKGVEAQGIGRDASKPDVERLIGFFHSLKNEYVPNTAWVGVDALVVSSTRFQYLGTSRTITRAVSCI
jgi:hypothetical protein